jgi:FkbM family methyltransferase
MLQAIKQRIGKSPDRRPAAKEDPAVYERRLAALEENSRQQRAVVELGDLVSYEAGVNLALRDLCRPGDVCFDAGAHAGFLTMLMSRLVGPAGCVCAFEPNETNVKLCRRNLNHNGCHNCAIVERAIIERSNEQVRFYIPEGQTESQVGRLHGTGDEYVTVNTLSLDDFIVDTKLRPQLIKMDVEGAEHRALLGCRKYLTEGKPHLILEQTMYDGDVCLLLLEELGYVVFDLSSYRVVRRMADYPTGFFIRNVLGVHRDRLDQTPYRENFTFRQVFDAAHAQFETHQTGNLVQREYRFPISAGRYALELKFDSEHESGYMELKAFVNEECRVQYGASPKWLRMSYRDFILDADKDSQILVQLTLSTDLTSREFALAGLTCSQIVDFRRRTPLMFA